MKTIALSCGTIRVDALEMHHGIAPDSYAIGADGKMTLALNALVVDTGKKVVVFDPGCADFLPARVIAGYELRIPLALEHQLASHGYAMDQVTDVVFTHLHFDHGSGAFSRGPEGIGKRFPNAAYHVLREHLEYARKPHHHESGSFVTSFFRRLGRISWLEDWKEDWMQFRVFYGHTRAMVVPVIDAPERKIVYLTDLVPLQSFMDRRVSSGYDLDPGLARREKSEFLDNLEPGSEVIFFHDPLTGRMIFQGS